MPGRSWLGLQPSLAFATEHVLLPAGWEQRHSEWPQWYTSALSAWLAQLRWPTGLPPDRAFAGVTFIELLTNFVVTTGCLPPVRCQHGSQWSWTNLLEATGVMLPAVARELIVQIVSSIDMIRKLCRIDAWPSPRHHKVRCLLLCDHMFPRKGLLYRPWLPSVQTTFEALQKVLNSDCPDGMPPGDCMEGQK